MRGGRQKEHALIRSLEFSVLPPPQEKTHAMDVELHLAYMMKPPYQIPKG